MSEELSVEEFLQLPEESVRKKVDYEKVIKAIEGKPMSVKRVGEIMLQCSEGKTKVYYSEIMRFLENLEKQGYEVIFRYAENNPNSNVQKGKYVLVRKFE